MTNKINVLIYALPNTSSGGLSVVLNLYEDIKKNGKSFSDIHWYFIVGTDGFENSDNITIYNEKWALKTYIHRWYYSKVCVKKFVKEHNIQAIISLNTSIKGINIPSIISMHNVLPLYHCGAEVFDNKSDMIKQALRNMMMVSSWKRADYIIVPSKWIAKSLERKFNIAKEQIKISPISTPEMNQVIDYECEFGNLSTNDISQFVYPASGFPYKNHKVIIEAAKKLKNSGINNYIIRFTGNVGNGKTIQNIRSDIEKNNLPIEFSGLLSKDELCKLYKTGTLIFPSKIETDGFPLLESMASRGYIIASDLDYAREALEGYDNYDLFDSDDSDRLAELMKNIISKSKELKDINNKGTTTNNSVKDNEYDNNLGQGNSDEKGIPRSSIIVPILRTMVDRERL